MNCHSLPNAKEIAESKNIFIAMNNLKTLNTAQPWDRVPDETDTAYHRFSIYLRFGPDRSFEKVRQEVGKSTAYIRQLEKWSSMYGWVRRSSEYDRHVIRKALNNHEKTLEHLTAIVLNEAEDLVRELIQMALMDGLQIVESNGGSQIINAYSQKLRAIESALDRIGFVRQKEVPETEEPYSVNNYIQAIYQKMELRDKEEGRE